MKQIINKKVFLKALVMMYIIGLLGYTLAGISQVDNARVQIGADYELDEAGFISRPTAYKWVEYGYFPTVNFWIQISILAFSVALVFGLTDDEINQEKQGP